MNNWVSASRCHYSAHPRSRPRSALATDTGCRKHQAKTFHDQALGNAGVVVYLVNFLRTRVSGVWHGNYHHSDVEILVIELGPRLGPEAPNHSALSPKPESISDRLQSINAKVAESKEATCTKDTKHAKDVEGEPMTFIVARKRL